MTTQTQKLITSNDPKGQDATAKWIAAYNKAQLTDGADGSAQRLNESKKFWKELALLIEEHSKPDKRFGIATTLCDVTIPIDYNSDTCVNDYDQKVKSLKTTYYYNDALISKNFPNPSNKLVPGKTYTIKLIPILETVKSEDCLKELARHNALLVGAQGIPVVDTAKLPKGKWYASFDQKENLWKDSDGRHRVPFVRANAGGDFKFSLGYFEGVWDGHGCLLCFCDKSLEA